MDDISKNVFVVHGRNLEARNSLFRFLRSIGLRPIEWDQAIKMTGKASPYIGEVLEIAFTEAQAIVVLFTPDDEVRLRASYRKDHDPAFESQLVGQARPNVLFEAGMAMGRSPEQTILIEIGNLRPFSDIGGRHTIRLNNSAESRHSLGQRLKTAGCSCELTGNDWLSEGDFNIEAIKIDSSTSLLVESHEIIIYDSKKRMVKFDFEGHGSYLAKDEKKVNGQGSFNVAEDLLSITRLNTDGSYVIGFRRYYFDGKEEVCIERRSNGKEKRKLRFHCEAKNSNSPCMLKIALVDYGKHEVRAYQFGNVLQDEWTPIDCLLSFDPNEEYLLQVHQFDIQQVGCLELKDILVHLR